MIWSNFPICVDTFKSKETPPELLGAVAVWVNLTIKISKSASGRD